MGEEAARRMLFAEGLLVPGAGQDPPRQRAVSLRPALEGPRFTVHSPQVQVHAGAG